MGGKVLQRLQSHLVLFKGIHAGVPASGRPLDWAAQGRRGRALDMGRWQRLQQLVSVCVRLSGWDLFWVCLGWGFPFSSLLCSGLSCEAEANVRTCMGTGSTQPSATARSSGCAAEPTATSSGGRGQIRSDGSHPRQLVPTLLGTPCHPCVLESASFQHCYACVSCMDSASCAARCLSGNTSVALCLKGGSFGGPYRSNPHGTVGWAVDDHCRRPLELPGPGAAQPAV